MVRTTPPAAIPASEFVRRRRALMRMAGDDAILILPAAPVRVRSNDVFWPYRQDSDFWYLCGFPEPEAVLVLVPGRAHGEALLFCRDRHHERERWDGERIGPQGAVERFGFDDAYPIDDIDDILPGLLEGRCRVYYHFGRDVDFDLKLMAWVNRVRAQAKRGAEPPHAFLELGHLLHELRLFKSAAELRQMRHAAAITARAHAAAMNAARVGSYEYQVEAALWQVWRAHDAQAAYPPIVAGGARACVLHYIDNCQPLAAGDLLLIDAGAEYRNYACDVTRTFPVGGRFRAEQRQLYQIVLDAQAAALAQARPGRSWIAGHEAAVEVICAGLLALGILKGSLKKALASESYKAFFMHKTGHWLGLDVHDVGDYRVAGAYRQLEPGMVFTVEPGIYIPADALAVPARWRGIGIRIEDDVVITDTGHEVLTAAIPKSIEAIEEALAARR